MSKNKDQASSEYGVATVKGFKSANIPLQDAALHAANLRDQLAAERDKVRHPELRAEAGRIRKDLKAIHDRLVDENDDLIRTLNDVGAILKLDGDDTMKLALIKTRITV